MAAPPQPAVALGELAHEPAAPDNLAYAAGLRVSAAGLWMVLAVVCAAMMLTSKGISSVFAATGRS